MATTTWTETEIATLEKALASGMKRIRIKDDEFEWQTTAEGLELLARMKREVRSSRSYRLAATSKGV